MFDRQSGAAGVVRDHESGAFSNEVEIDRDARNRRAGEPLSVGVALLDAHQYHPVDAVVARALEVRMGSETVSGLFRREQKQVVPAGSEPTLEPDEDFLEERVLDVGMIDAGREDDSNDVRPLGYEGSGRCVGCVLELLRELEHALPGRRTDVVVVVQDSRHGRNRDSAQFRKFSNRGDFATPSENVSGGSNHCRRAMSRAVREGAISSGASEAK